jgi:hypothetical protein
VEILWMIGEKAVDAATGKFISREVSPQFTSPTIVDAPSWLASLDRLTPPRKNARSSTTAHRQLVPNLVHHFEESIAGRPYLIEVAPVSRDRWRAYLLRAPGLSTALMPFYGPTPDEAARLLTDWLNRAHRRAAGGSAG